MDTLITIGGTAPNFSLPDLDGNLHSLESMQGKIRVLYFWSAECTWCERVDAELMSYLNTWSDQVKVLWIAANTYESKEVIAQVAAERKLPLVLLDSLQQAAELYGAEITPQFFVIDEMGKLRYTGAWDDVTFERRKATQWYLPQAIDALRMQRALEIIQTQPYGCVLVREG